MSDVKRWWAAKVALRPVGEGTVTLIGEAFPDVSVVLASDHDATLAEKDAVIAETQKRAERAEIAQVEHNKAYGDCAANRLRMERAEATVAEGSLRPLCDVIDSNAQARVHSGVTRPQNPTGSGESGVAPRLGHFEAQMPDKFSEGGERRKRQTEPVVEANTGGVVYQYKRNHNGWDYQLSPDERTGNDRRVASWRPFAQWLIDHTDETDGMVFDLILALRGAGKGGERAVRHDARDEYTEDVHLVASLVEERFGREFDPTKDYGAFWMRIRAAVKAARRLLAAIEGGER